MARQMLAFDRLLPADELIGRVEEVTPEAVRDIAASLVTGSPLSFALVGAGERGQAYASLAEPVARM